LDKWGGIIGTALAFIEYKPEKSDGEAVEYAKDNY